MKVTVSTMLGKVNYTFELDEKSELDALHKAAVLGNPPTVCEVCGNKDPEKFRLVSNKDTEANIYVNVHCDKCEANAKLGQYKAGGYFFHNFKTYVKGEK